MVDVAFNPAKTVQWEDRARQHRYPDRAGMKRMGSVHGCAILPRMSITPLG